MRVPCQPTAPPPPPRPARRVVAVLCLAVAAALATFVVCDGREALDAWARRAGHHRIETTTSFWRALASAPLRWLAPVAAPHLDLDIGFQHVHALRAAQARAVERGWIDAENKDWVPAGIVTDGVRQRGQVRLKGDLLDHVTGDKVSLRLRLPADAHWRGLRHFSLQAPETKGWQLEALFHATARFAGVLAPRYEFVTLAINGDRVGVMAVEEHCARELLERNGCRDSVIVRFDESALFRTQNELGSVDPAVVVLDDYRTAPVRVFHEAEVAQDPALARLRDAGIALLRGFVQETLPASAVFDVPRLSSYLAVCELWGTWHALRWHNLRFHLDPVSGLLAPVAFDGNLQMRRPVGRTVVGEEPIIRRLLADPRVDAAFRARLGWLCQQVLEGPLLDSLQREEAGVLPLLRRDYVLLGGYPFAELRDRARFHQEVSDAALRAPGLLLPRHRPVHACLVDGCRVELQNASPWPALVHALRWRDAEGLATAPVAARGGSSWPLRLEAKPAAGAIPVAGIDVEPPPAAMLFLEYEAELDGAPGSRRWWPAVPQPPAAVERLVPHAAMAEVLANHPGLRAEVDGGTLVAPAGRLEIHSTLVVPAGCRLRLEAGAELRFASDAALIAHGPLLALGEAGREVVLGPLGSAEGWPGLAVLAPEGETSRLQHARIETTRGLRLGAWQPTGAVTFQGGRVELHDVTFAGSRAEDALNVIHAEIDLQRVAFAETASDAFDGDFVNGTLRGCSFSAIGGDALDFSGSRVDVLDCAMAGVRDKALSVGEASTVHARGLRAETVGAGAVCKDGSRLRLEGARIAWARVAAVMAYEKKPGYGGAALEAMGLAALGPAPAAICQSGSTLTIDGVAAAAQALDVESLYATEMRKR